MTNGEIEVHNTLIAILGELQAINKSLAKLVNLEKGNFIPNLPTVMFNEETKND